jgi:aspartate/methionine/tyrosine aminotransferase
LKIAPFRIEQYFAVHEFTAPHLLSSSDAETVSVASVLALEPDATDRLGSLALGYTQSDGALELRAAASAIYTTTTAQDIVVVSAAEEAIFAAYHALLQPGDHVVVETPCYESALQLARSTGADVSEWRRSADAGWAHDLAALERVMRTNTRMVYINTPHNPTGALMPRTVLDRVIELCAARKAWLFCDEVYRELEHDPAALLPAAVDLYEHAISLGSMSKTYGLPGLRLGWLASHDRAALTTIIDFKHYTTICSSAPSEFLSAVALRHRSVFADRSRAIVLANLALIDALMRSIVPVPERSSIVLNPRDPNAFLSSKHSITRSPVALRGKEKCEICVFWARGIRQQAFWVYVCLVSEAWNWAWLLTDS